MFIAYILSYLWKYKCKLILKFYYLRPRTFLIDNPMHFPFPFYFFFLFSINCPHNSSFAIFCFHFFKAHQAITTTCKQFVCRILLDICDFFPRFYGCPAHTYFESIFQATHLYKLVFKAYNLVFIETTLCFHTLIFKSLSDI